MGSKYLAIYSNIVEAIESKEYKTHEKLPSEADFMEIYQVSRDTIRKSLQMLEQNGYIQKFKGKEAVVLDVSKFDLLVSGVTSFKELAPLLGHDILTIVVSCKLLKDDKKAQQLLQAPSDVPIWKIERIRRIEHEKIIFDTDYLRSDIVLNVTEDIAKHSLYEYIENELNLKISYAKKEITVQPASKLDRTHLDLKHFDVVVSVKSVTYLDNLTLFQFTESRHRPDKFKFVDFARRTK